MTVRTFALGALTLLTPLFVACNPETVAIATYFDEAQSVADRMVESGVKFETLMNVADPMAATDEINVELDTVVSELTMLRDEAAAMSVPADLVDVHPLLVESLVHMVDAVSMIQEIAADPSKATMARLSEMDEKASEGERLANEYAQKLEEVLAEKYPEMLEE